MRRIDIVTHLLLATLWVSLASVTGTARADEPQAASAAVDFDSDIRPIFAQHCFLCHGKEEQESDFRLDLSADALKGGENGVAIVPGKADASPLVQRIASSDPDVRMPPKGDALSAESIALIRRWVEQGAKFPTAAPGAAESGGGPWSLRPLVRPPVPQVAGPVPVNPLDAFIQARLAERGLASSAPADGRTLLRRLSIDLTGLPPTPEELAAFLADTSADAYERQVERLLASPRYGERWARHWIDVVHFAETHGNDQDRPRPNAWPYRDYLIQSFNEDKPYARFVSEQVAGNALYPEDPQATVALGFLSSGSWDESTLMSIQDDTVDRKMGQVIDRDDMITTVMSTVCSATVHCARCHNHKFDPITQADYYALQAVFAGVDRTERPFDASAAVSLRRKELTLRKQDLQSRPAAWFAEPEQQALAATIEPALDRNLETWRMLTPVALQTANGSAGVAQPDGSLLFSGPRPETETYTYTFEGDFRGSTAIQLDALADASLPTKGPGRQDNGNFHLSEINITIGPLAEGNASPVPIGTAVADYNQGGWEIERTFDGVDSTAWGIYPEVSKSHTAVFVLKEPISLSGPARLTVVLKQLHGGGHLIGRPRLSITSAAKPGVAKPLSPESVTALDTPAAARTAQQKVALAQFMLLWDVDRELGQLPAIQFCYAVANRATSNGVPIMPPAQPRPVHVLRRGDINQPLEEAAPGTISCIAGLPSRFSLENPADEAARRAALAKWLIAPQNVLTWRSIVNRVWHHHFGRGIVDTPNDLGVMGGQPSHPELLDWLAVEFRDQGGSLKALHRLIVSSAAYRQSSQIDPQRAQLDAENRLLWRMNRSRLDAETTRDAVLQTSGKLDLTMGGPSVKQFIQTPGIHVTPNVDYLTYDLDAPGTFRRSVYRFLFRTLPDPLMESLDCPDGAQLAPTRSESMTALQALTMLDNRFIVRLSEHTATRLAQAAPLVPDQVRLLFQSALLRAPTPAESQRWEAYATRHGLANACRMMFNTNEFMFVD